MVDKESTDVSGPHPIHLPRPSAGGTGPIAGSGRHMTGPVYYSLSDDLPNISVVVYCRRVSVLQVRSLDVPFQGSLPTGGHLSRL